MNIHNKKISAVVSDFDGTIIKHGMSIPPERFFINVEKLLEKGIPFIAASGRQYANLRRILSPIADRIDFIAENGCLVAHNNEIIHKCVIPHALAQELIADLRTVPDTEITISAENTLYLCTQNKEYIDLLSNKVKNNVTVISDPAQITDDIIKISIHWETGIPAEPEKYFHQKYDALLAVANGGNGWLDFNPLGSSKGAALRVLASHIGIPTSEMIAFGDNENDIAMLKEAGISYAVTTALPHVKDVCDHICENVEDVLEEMLDAE